MNFHQTSVNEKARREAAISQSQFNLRTCAKGNRTARVVNAPQASTFAITKAASDVSGDPSSATARYGRSLTRSALPDMDLPPTDCAAVVKLYTPTPSLHLSRRCASLSKQVRRVRSSNGRTPVLQAG